MPTTIETVREALASARRDGSLVEIARPAGAGFAVRRALRRRRPSPERLGLAEARLEGRDRAGRRAGGRADAGALARAGRRL